MLGKRRLAVGGEFVAGEGAPGGILFLGEGPGRVEENLGRPFVGEAGQLLRDVLGKLNFRHAYLTNIVPCRSCEALIDPATNTPRLTDGKYGPPRIMYRDVVPKPLEIDACLARLYEEIYIVDPVIIVTLGVTAAEALLKKRVPILTARGATQHCAIPGATDRAEHTEKRQVWGRKHLGEWRFPTTTNEVRYLVLPTLHPAYVTRKMNDQGASSPFRQFADDIKKAVRIYEKYMSEIHGEVPRGYADTDLTSVGAGYGIEAGEEDTRE